MNDNNARITQLLKECNPTLYKIDEFIRSMGKMGWGQVDIKIKVRNYTNYKVEMTASGHKDEEKTYFGKKFDAVIDKNEK